jgi:hypothetical protein
MEKKNFKSKKLTTGKENIIAKLKRQRLQNWFSCCYAQCLTFDVVSCDAKDFGTIV